MCDRANHVPGDAAVAAGEELLWEYPVHKGAAAAAAPKRKRTEEYEASLAGCSSDIEINRANIHATACRRRHEMEAPQFVGEHFDEYFRGCGWFRGTVKSVGGGTARAHNGRFGRVVPEGKLLVRYSDGCDGVKTVEKLRELMRRPKPDGVGYSSAAATLVDSSESDSDGDSISEDDATPCAAVAAAVADAAGSEAMTAASTASNASADSESSKDAVLEVLDGHTADTLPMCDMNDDELTFEAEVAASAVSATSDAKVTTAIAEIGMEMGAIPATPAAALAHTILPAPAPTVLTESSSTAPPLLPGGYVVGERVFYTGGSQTFPSGNKLTHGQAGEVKGGSKPEGHAIAANVAFPGIWATSASGSLTSAARRRRRCRADTPSARRSSSPETARRFRAGTRSGTDRLAK